MKIRSFAEGVICLAILLSVSQPAKSQEAMFRGNLAHTGNYAGPGIAHEPKLKWTFHTNGRVYSSAAVVDGVVFVGSTDNNLYAVDADTGKERWKFPTHARIVSSPAVSRGVLFFESYDGNCYALDAGNGTLKWKFATSGERRFAAPHIHGIMPAAETVPDPFDFYLSSPAVWNGAVYFGSGDGNVYALDEATGALKWKFKTGDVVHSSPAIADGMVFIGSWDTYFYALDARTGAEKWRFKTGEDPKIHNQVGIQSSAAVADGVVYFGCRDSNLYALDELRGKKLWAYNNKGSWVIASPAVRDGKVYVATSDSGLFYALDAKTGAQIFQLDFKHWPMFSSPALVGQFAYIGSYEGKLLAIDVKNGRLAWEFQTPSSQQLLAKYLNADGTPNYRAAQKGNFYDDLVAGVDNMMDIGSILASPTVAGNLIIFGATDGNVYALQG